MNASMMSLDVVLAVPRFIRRAGDFAIFTVPEHLDALFGRGYGSRVIAQATGEGVAAASSAGAGAAMFVQGASAGAGSAAGANGQTSDGFNAALGFSNVRGLGGVISYATGKWALTCFTMAVVLNRTQIYASTRRHLQLDWKIRFVLRGLIIYLHLQSVVLLLESMRCQTSPDYPLYRYNNPEKVFERDYAGTGGALYWLSSTLLFWQDDQRSCSAASMVPTSFDPSDTSRLQSLRGSLSLLWPMFQNVCLSQFVETLSCAIQGRPAMAETGMTIFEHSVAFAEAEAAVSYDLGFGPLVPSNRATTSKGSLASSSATVITRSALLQRLNTPPEVLLMALISSLNHLTSNVLALFEKQGEYRLLSTGIWGLCFMGAFVWKAFEFSVNPTVDFGILQFPTMCIIGFIPHLLILISIGVCAVIYAIALTITALSPPPGHEAPRSLTDRVRMAYDNLQVNIQFSTIRISLAEDFYTTLLKIGFTALTAASEAVFLNECTPVAVRRWTWLEEERMREVEVWRHGDSTSVMSQRADIVEGIGLADREVNSQNRKKPVSGYAKERTTTTLKSGKVSRKNMGIEGVGASERSSRWLCAFELIRGIFLLMASSLFKFLSKLMDKLGLVWRPQWMRRLTGPGKDTGDKDAVLRKTEENELEFWLLSEDGELRLPRNRDVDVEVEMRKRLYNSKGRTAVLDESKLDSNLYSWWKQGGWFGELDESGTYEPGVIEDDVSSVVSTVESLDGETEWSTDEDSTDGQITPKRSYQDPNMRQGSIVSDLALDTKYLARLLDPRDAEEQQEARILAHHLNELDVVTRSRHQQRLNYERAKVLTSTRQKLRGLSQGDISAIGIQRTPEDESKILEQLILSRRAEKASLAQGSAQTDSSSLSWVNGGEGLGSGGPQCVVCQSSPRIIIVWPCRCLSLCEECRVSLAMNNFGNCVCCRRDVLAFSRIFTP